MQARITELGKMHTLLCRGKNGLDARQQRGPLNAFIGLYRRHKGKVNLRWRIGLPQAWERARMCGTMSVCNADEAIGLKELL